MALSNITTEPRREITEQVLGTLTFAGFLAVDYFAAKAAASVPEGPPIFIGMMLIPFGVMAIGLLCIPLFMLVHGVGDLMCEGLAKIGLDPRPRKRYTRNWEGKVVERR